MISRERLDSLKMPTMKEWLLRTQLSKSHVTTLTPGDSYPYPHFPCPLNCSSGGGLSRFLSSWESAYDALFPQYHRPTFNRR